jgi:hypothetical protein
LFSGLVHQIKDRGDLIQIATPDMLSIVAKQEMSMTNTLVQLSSEVTCETQKTILEVDPATGLNEPSSKVEDPKTRKYSKVLRKGDLAIVVKDDSDQLNLGVVVQILHVVGQQFWWPWDSTNKRWADRSRLMKTVYVEALSARGLSYHSYQCNGDLVLQRFGSIPAAHLKKIRS